MASARLGGKMTWISSGLPVSDRRSRTGSLLESGALDPVPVDRPALDGLPEAVADEPALGPIGAGSEPLVVGAAGFKWCSPTATEWAHNVPHSRDCRHGQMFSMSSSCWMTSPARSELASDMTTPFRSGGVQFEDRTLPEASSARACFITSQPAALAKKASVSCKVDTGLEGIRPSSEPEADQAFQGSVAGGLARNPSALCPHLHLHGSQCIGGRD